jgi:hypothetical protein
MGATETIRTVCKETFQSLVTRSTTMELNIEVIGSLEHHWPVRREYSKEMRLLVKNQKESEPKEAVMPDKGRGKVAVPDEGLETELKKYYFTKEIYKDHKAKIFVIVRRQCTLNMKNKVESLKGYDSIEARADVQNAQ